MRADGGWMGDLPDVTWQDIRRDVKKKYSREVNQAVSDVTKQGKRFSPSRYIRKKLVSAAIRLEIMDKEHGGSVDGGDYQTQPGCRINPDNYIGHRADTEALWTRTRRGIMGDNPTHAKCGGCYSEVELEHGRIPPHQPGPPPFTQCPMCGRPYEGGVALYTQVICNECARNIDAQAYERGDGDMAGNVLLDGVNDWASGNWGAAPPNKGVARFMAKEHWGHVDAMNEWDSVGHSDQYDGIPL